MDTNEDAATRLQPDLDPVQLRRLEELRGLQTAEQMLPVQRLRLLFMELVEDPAFQQLLVGHADLDRVAGRAPVCGTDTVSRPRRRRRVGVASR